MDIKELQIQYDILNKQVTSLNKAKKVLTTQAENAGFILKGSTFVKNKPVYGIFYDLTYYSHFDGHRSGAVNDFYIGSGIVSIENFNLLKNLIQNNIFNEEQKEQMYDILEYIPECVNIDSDNFIKHFKIISDTEIKWEYKGRNDQGELRNGSSFTIKLTTEKEINKVKTEEYTEID